MGVRRRRNTTGPIALERARTTLKNLTKRGSAHIGKTAKRLPGSVGPAHLVLAVGTVPKGHERGLAVEVFAESSDLPQALVQRIVDIVRSHKEATAAVAAAADLSTVLPERPELITAAPAAVEARAAMARHMFSAYVKLKLGKEKAQVLRECNKRRDGIFADLVKVCGGGHVTNEMYRDEKASTCIIRYLASRIYNARTEAYNAELGALPPHFPDKPMECQLQLEPTPDHVRDGYDDDASYDTGGNPAAAAPSPAAGSPASPASNPAPSGAPTTADHHDS